ATARTRSCAALSAVGTRPDGTNAARWLISMSTSRHRCRGNESAAAGTTRRIQWSPSDKKPMGRGTSMHNRANQSAVQDRENRLSEFLYFLAAEGDLESLVNEHVRDKSGTSCVGCGKCWPCNWRKLADQALEVLRRGLV